MVTERAGNSSLGYALEHNLEHRIKANNLNITVTDSNGTQGCDRSKLRSKSGLKLRLVSTMFLRRIVNIIA